MCNHSYFRGKKIFLNPHNCPNWKRFLISLIAVCLFLVRVQDAWPLPLHGSSPAFQLCSRALGAHSPQKSPHRAPGDMQGHRSPSWACPQLPCRPTQDALPCWHSSISSFQLTQLSPHKDTPPCCLHTLCVALGTERLEWSQSNSGTDWSPKCDTDA